MFKLLIITKSTNNVEVYEENEVSILESMHTELEEKYDPSLYRLDVVDQDGVSVFSGKVAV